MPNFNSIVDAIHSHIDRMVEKGVIENDSIKAQSAEGSLHSIALAYLKLLDSDKAKELEKENEYLDHDIADQLSFALDVMGECAVSGGGSPTPGPGDDIIYDGGDGV